MKVTNFGPGGLPVTVAGWSTGIVSLNSNVEVIGGGPAALNFVQRITSNTSNTLLNPIVNFASGSNIAFAVQSNTLTIIGAAGGGGAPTVISAGSNSTRVSEISGAGASSTLWSPFDHQHDGIGTITSSSSNTMQRGTWNIRPGAGIALSLTDTDGDGEFDTTTIVATGAGGGSSSSSLAYGTPERALVDPTGLSWSWVNQGGASIATQGAALYLSSPAEAADNWHLRIKALANSKPYTEIFHITPSVFVADFPTFGCGWLQSSNNNWASVHQVSQTGLTRLSSGKSGTNYFVTVNYTENIGQVEHWRWFALCDDSTNRRIWVSKDGNNWLLFHSVATNDFITPDRVFFGFEARDATYAIGMIVDSVETHTGSTP